ncbi:hypothetical protein SNEBB_009530 [Seison nebaliae]|nr:hypothetical protein SNEBB_009530 [Seison nebaliae]
MSWWPEIDRFIETNQHEMVLRGEEISNRFKSKENGELPEKLFKLKVMNFLEISQTILKSLPNQLSQLTNLKKLSLDHNQLETLPETFGYLRKLENFDVSFNQIKSLPESLKDCESLKSINLNNNQLESFDIDTTNLTKLLDIDISNNGLTTIKSNLTTIPSLLHLDLSDNQIEKIDATFQSMELHLKTLDLSGNELEDVFNCNIGELIKLTSIQLRHNPLKDRRLKKLVDQKKPAKLIREYIDKTDGAKCPSSNRIKEAKKKKEKEENNLEKILKCSKYIQVIESKEQSPLEIRATVKALTRRPYIVCCVVHDVDLESTGKMRQFLNIQNKLHADLCQHRLAATIGTHDLELIKDNILYLCGKAQGIQFKPLGRSKMMTGAEFHKLKYDEADQQRKQVKKQKFTAANEYLIKCRRSPFFSFFQDGSGNIISLPPLSNSEHTKITTKSKRIFIEVTGDENQELCTNVMERLLGEMMNHEICCMIKRSSFNRYLRSPMYVRTNSTINTTINKAPIIPELTKLSLESFPYLSSEKPTTTKSKTEAPVVVEGNGDGNENDDDLINIIRVQKINIKKITDDEEIVVNSFPTSTHLAKEQFIDIDSTQSINEQTIMIIR